MIKLVLYTVAITAGFGICAGWGIWSAVNDVNIAIFLFVAILGGMCQGVIAWFLSREMFRYFDRKHKRTLNP